MDNRNDPNLGTRWFDERIEAYLDDELPAGERRLFEAQLRLDETLQRELDRARAIAGALRAPDLNCPPHLEQAILQSVGEQPSNFRKRILAPLALAASLLLAVGVGFELGVSQGPDPAAAPSTTELERARTELAVALGVLDQVSNKAQRKVEHYWLHDGMVEPLQRGLGKVVADTGETS